jgi:transcriptional regulator with XRE-family HTH domain
MVNKFKRTELENLVLIILLSQNFSQQEVCKMVGRSPATVRRVMNPRGKAAIKAWSFLRKLNSVILQYEDKINLFEKRESNIIPEDKPLFNQGTEKGLLG